MMRLSHLVSNIVLVYRHVTKCLTGLLSILCFAFVVSPLSIALLQLRWYHNRSAALPWQKASLPKMSPLSLHLHLLPGTHQKTLPTHLNPYQWGPRVPPSPCQLSRLTQLKTRLPPALQRALMPSPLCPGHRASGSPSVIISHHLAVRVQRWLRRSSRGLSQAPEGQVASTLMTLLMPTAKRQ